MNSRLVRFTAFGFAVCFALGLLARTASAAACALTAADFAALRLSHSKLASQAQVDAQPPDRQTMLCKTRLRWNRVAAGTSADGDLEGISPFYLSPSERRAYGKLMNARAHAVLKKMPKGEWGKISKETLDALTK
jgi:hypothetical protein